MVKTAKKTRPQRTRARKETTGSRTSDAKSKDDEKTVFAQMMVKGVATNATAAAGYSKMLGELDLMECVRALREETRKVRAGDMAVLESTLAAQTVTLNTMFTQLAYEASKMQVVDHIDRFTRLAFKAQSQCRSTVETLALMKSPPIVFAKQANVAHGPQQVNNALLCPPAGRESYGRARDSNSDQNELMEAHGKRLDAGAADSTIDLHQTLAPVGLLNRSAHK